MISILAAVILGLVEGLTEFLPVSSTGHLILTSSLLGLTGEKVATFEIVIQLGAILAVVVLYRQRFLGLLRPRGMGRFSGLRGLSLLFLTSLPAGLLGLLARKPIKAYLFNPQSVALALAVGAVALLLVESRQQRSQYRALEDMTPALALGIGLFQCLALWPGFSRSGATIMGGLVLGANRRLAAEYSFLAAVPLLTAATGWDFYKNYALFDERDLLVLAIGFVVSFVSALAAVRWFVGFVGSASLRPFAWYRLILAPVVWFFWPK